MEKRFKKFTNTNENGVEVVEDRSFIIWHFAVDEEGFEGVTLTAISSTSFGPKAKARRWAGAIRRKKYEDGEKVREDDLKGKPVILNVDLEENDRGMFAKVVDLSPVRSRKGASKKEDTPKGRELTEEDIQDMNDALGGSSEKVS